MLLKLDIRKASSVASTSPAVLGRVQASPRRGRARPARLSTVAALGFFKRKIATSGAVDDLLAAIEGSERGCRTSKSQRARIDAALGVLEEAGYDNVPINKSLSATWRLVWTTEKVRLPAGSATLIAGVA